MMTLHLGVVNGGTDMVNRAWGHVHDMMVRMRCPGDLGGDICAWLCVYVFIYVWIVLYDMGGCHMDVVIDTGEVE